MDLSTSACDMLSVADLALEGTINEFEERLRSRRLSVNQGYEGGMNTADDVISSFINTYEAEIMRVANTIDMANRSIEAYGESLLMNIESLSVIKNKRGDVTVELEKIQGDASMIETRVLGLNRATQRNAEKLRSIAVEADRRLGTACEVLAQRKFSSEPWTCEASTTKIVSLLSDLYDVIRELKHGTKKRVWAAPSKFDRTTYKYWVEEEKAAEVMLKCVSELPLLVYGRSGRIMKSSQTDLGKSSKALWSDPATPITSVYFDNKTLDMYKERIKRSEGAKLLRARWYGERPHGKEVVFLELKTHHEKWVNTKSLKQRVAIQEQYMCKLLDIGNPDWTQDYARVVVGLSNPNAARKDIDSATNLLLEIRSLICHLELRPCVRTQYIRAAFQSSQNNNLRFTLDRNIIVIDERKNTQGTSWCLDEDASVSVESIVNLPYSVFEVKVASGEIPSRIQDLQISNVITSAAKFSKFLTGVATFNSNERITMPWWASNSAFASIFYAGEKKDEEQGTSQTSESSITNGYDISEGIHQRDKQSDDRIDNNAAHGVSVLNEQIVNTVEKRPHDKQKCRRYLSLCCFKRHSAKIAPKVPARVEPKSYFANERTFIQWFSAALLLVTISELFFIMADADEYSRITAIVLISFALFLLCYSLVTYYRRIYLMRTGKPYGYTDFIGPGVLTAVTITGIIMLMNFKMGEHALFNRDPELATIHQSPGECIQRNITGVPALEYEPSDAVIDAQRGLVLIPSFNLITAINSEIPLSSTNSYDGLDVLAKVPAFLDDVEVDMEALEIINGTLYAVSEAESFSELLAFEWSDADTTLSLIRRWRISTPAVEGMVYIPDYEGGKLLIAGRTMNVGTSEINHGIVHIYDVPDVDMDSSITRLRRVSKLNMAMLQQGDANRPLVDTKISAMRYFEGLLYILFDNEVIIQAWDLSYGKIMAEWKLATLPGFEKQWEGFALERRQQIDGNILVLHLTLDSPPQVWSIVLSEPKDGSDNVTKWMLPKCAQGNERQATLRYLRSAMRSDGAL